MIKRINVSNYQYWQIRWVNNEAPSYVPYRRNILAVGRLRTDDEKIHHPKYVISQANNYDYEK